MKWVVDDMRGIVTVKGKVKVERPGHEESVVYIPLVMDFAFGTSMDVIKQAFEEMRKRIEALPDPYLEYKV